MNSVFSKKRGLSALFLISLLCSCTKKEAPSATVEEVLTPAQKVEKGKHIYMANCISCHNANPDKDGAVGPAVFGSSLELLEARILFAKYPTGYTPKRNSALMAVLPHLKEEIPNLHAFLNTKVQ